MRQKFEQPVEIDNTNLKLFSDYVAAALALCENVNDPDGVLVERLSEADAAVTEKFVRFTSHPWTREQSDSFKPSSVSDGITCTTYYQNKMLADKMQLDTPHRQTRGAFITLGRFAATSGALATKSLPAAYGILHRATERLGPDPSFTQFAFQRIRADLYYDYWRSRHNVENSWPLEPPLLESNIRAAWDIIGYPFGNIGKAAIHIGKYLPVVI